MSEFQVKALLHGKLGRSYHINGCPDKHSPDSACSVDYSSSRLSSPDHPNEDSESTEPLSVDGASDLEEQADGEDEEDAGTSMVEGEVPKTPDQEKFLKQHFETLANSSEKGGSCRTLEKTENISISSRFLSQSPSLRRLSRSLSNPILDQKSIGASAQSKQVSPDLLKNGNSHCNATLENDNLLNGVNSYRCIYTQRKRKSAVETNRLTVGPGRVIEPFPEATGNAGMRKCQSVHDLLHDDKSPGTMSSTKQRPQTLAVVEKDPKPNNCRQLSASLLKMDGSNSLVVKDSKVTKPKSYMNPTTSFMAKMSRSISVGENLCIGDLAETLTEERTSSQGSEKIQLTPPAETEKNKSPTKENVPGKQALQQVVSCSSPKPFHSKLASSNRAHLILDIPKPLPDRPTLASFSPTTKSKTPLEPESPQSPAGFCKKKSSLLEGRVFKRESPAAVSVGPAKESLVENPALRTERQDEQGVTNPKLKEFSEGLHPRSPESTLPKCRERFSSIGCVVDSPLGLCPLDPIRPRSPTTVATSAQDSERSISIEQCKHVVSELQDSMRKAVHLYRLVSMDMESSTDKDKIAGLLTETFSVMKKELDSLKEGEGLQRAKKVLVKPQDAVGSLSEGSDAGLSSPTRFGDEQTLALLEQYSELLLQAVERRMDKKL